MSNRSKYIVVVPFRRAHYRRAVAMALGLMEADHYWNIVELAGPASVDGWGAFAAFAGANPYLAHSQIGRNVPKLCRPALKRFGFCGFVRHFFVNGQRFECSPVDWKRLDFRQHEIIVFAATGSVQNLVGREWAP